MHKIFLTALFSFIIALSYLTHLHAFNDRDESKIRNVGPLFISIDAGYRYPTQSINTFDQGFDIPKTSADKIYNDGFAFGFKAGLIIYPLIFSLSFDSAVYSLTETGKIYAQNINPTNAIHFGPFIGAYFYETGILSFYAGLSPGFIHAGFSSGNEEVDENNDKQYFSLHVQAGIQIRPFDLDSYFKNIFFSVNFKYLAYMNKKAIPNDFMLTLGAGIHIGL